MRVLPPTPSCQAWGSNTPEVGVNGIELTCGWRWEGKTEGGSSPLFLSLSFLPLFLSLSFSPSLSLPLFLSLSFSPSLSLPLFLFLSFSPSLSLPLFLSLSFSPSLSLPLFLSLSFSQELRVLDPYKNRHAYGSLLLSPFSSSSPPPFSFPPSPISLGSLLDVLGSRTDVWMEVGGSGGGGLHGTHEVGGGGGGGGTGRGLTKGVGGGGGRGVGRGVGRRRLLGLKGRSVAYLRADSSGLLASPPWLPALQQLGVSKGYAGRRRGDTGAGEGDEAIFLPPALTDEARRLFNAFAHRFRCAIGAPMPAHHATSGAASSATAASVARTGEAAAAGATRAAGAAGAAGTVGEAAIPIPMPRMPPHWPVLYLLLHACDKLTFFGLIRNASVHVLQSPMHVPSVRSELHRRPSLLVLESLLHALARTNLLSCCGGIEDHFCRLLPGAGSGIGKGEVASGAGGFDAGMAGGSVAGDGGGMVERGLGKGGQERRGEEGMAQRRENTWSGAGGDTADASGNTGSTDLGQRSVNEEDYDEDEVDSRGKTGKVVGGQGAVEGAGWGDEYGDEGEEWGEGGEGEGGGEGATGGEDDYEYDDDYYGAPIEELMSDLEHANVAHAQEVQQTDA
ncbi:unnamed protein product [Closterium sp. Naga37s-1]|nr:unnamed protein product [Closterium sp. Naga37s-1]